MHQAAEIHPNYLGRQRIDAADLRQLSEPCVIFEHAWRDSDGAKCWAYTVGGWLNGRPLGSIQGGATVGGEIIIVHADNREDADMLAGMGLEDSISALHAEAAQYVEAHAALARLGEVGPVRRVDLATAAPGDMSDAFVADSQAIRKLRGDDIVLTTGGTKGPAH